MRRILLGLSMIALTVAAAPSADAQAVRAIGGLPMGPGDDNYEPNNYGFFINFYGTFSDAGQVCKNGYTILNYFAPSTTNCAYPGAPAGGDPPAAPNLANLRAFYGATMAPYFSDVNTSFAGSGNVYVGNGLAEGNLAWAVTWDGVRGYAGPGLSTFQLVLIDRGGAGDFTMEFNYGTLGWAAEGGIGFTNDDPNVVQNFTPTRPAYDTRIKCDFIGGTPTCSTGVVPEPSTFVLMGSALAGMFGVALRRRRNNS